MSRSLRLLTVICVLGMAAAPAAAQPVPISFGEAVSGELVAEGDTVVYTFDAVHGQTVFLNQTATNNLYGLNWKLADAWGRTLVSNFTALWDLGPVPLMGGEYTITVMGEGAAVGTFEFTLVDAVSVSGELLLGGELDSAIEVPGQQRHFTFDAAAGQVLFLDGTATSNYWGLNWRLVDPYGRDIQPWTPELRDIGPLTLVEGTHRLSVRGEGDATGTFAATLRLPTPGAGSFAIDEEVSGAIETPGQYDTWTFTATAGQRVVLDGIATSNYWGLDWSLVSDTGRVIVPMSTDLADRGPFVLEAGVHTLTVQGEGEHIGTYTFRVATVEDGASTIAIGEAVSGAIALPGQQNVYEFSAEAGQVVTLDMLTTSNLGALNWQLADANGRLLVARTGNLYDVERVTLEGGDYTLTVMGEPNATGTYEFQVATVTDDVGALAVGGTVSGALDAPGDTDSWTFTAAAGQVVSLDQVESSNPWGLNWRLTDALGRDVLARTNSIADVGPFTLQGGTYTVTVLSEHQHAGTYSFTLVDDGTETYTPAGTSIAVGDVVAGSIDAAGQIDRYQLTLAADTRVFVDLTVGARFVTWTLRDPVGQSVFGPTEARYPDSQDRGPWTLAAGTYTFEVYHADDGAAPYEFQVIEVVDGAGTFGLEEVVDGNIATPGAANTLTFELAAPTRVYLDLLAGGTRLYWTLTDPAGGAVFTRGRARYDHVDNPGPWTLGAGTYTLVLDPDYGDTPTYQFQLREVGDESFTAAVGDVVSGTFTEPGERHVVTFDVTAGQRIYLDLQTGHASLRWTLEDALGDLVFADAQARYANTQDQGPFVLPPGTTRVTLDPIDDDLMPYAFRILAIEDTETTIAVDEVVASELTTPGVRHGHTFTLAEPTRLYFDAQVAANDTYWTLTSAAGQTIFQNVSFRFTDSRTDQGPFVLPAGDYRLEFWSTALPSYQFQVIPVLDTVGTLPPNTVTPGAIASAGGVATYTFEVTEDGRTVVLDLQEGGTGLLWSMEDEVGAPLFTNLSAVDPIGGDYGPVALAAGTYTVVMDGDYDLTPSFALQAFQHVPPVPGNCAEGDEPTPERCDGVDNDCDGLVDEEDYGNWDIYQGGEFLGPVTTLETFEPVGVFYSYGAGFHSSYNGATLPPVSQESLIFVHRNLLDDELSFVIVHDQPEDGDGGEVNFEVRGMGVRAHVAQADDPGEISDNDFDGFGNAYFQWRWETCCTDGVAIADVDWRNCITVVPDFVSGVDAWNYLTDDVNDPTRIPLDMTAPLSVCPSICAACPPPDAAGGQVPTPVDLAPAVGEAVAAGTPIVLSGRVPAYPTRPVRGVIVNGVPAQVDATGRFWAPVVVAAGENAYTIEVVERCGVSETTVVITGEPPDAATTLTDISTRLTAEYRDTTWNPALDRLFVEVRARADGQDAAVGAALMEIGPQLDTRVSIEHADGTTEAGLPYLGLLDEGVTLSPGQATDWRALAFVDAERVPVRYNVRWLGRGNRAPVFTTAPPTVAASTRPWTYAATASDADGHAVGYALDGAPEGMSLDPESGELSWTPAVDDVGRHEIALAASDGFGGRAVQRFTLTVEDGSSNHPPVFTTAPLARASIGEAYAYDADALDADGDTLAFTLEAGPTEAGVGGETGLVTWPFALPGTHTLSVRAEDGRGGSARQTWTLAVGELPENPGAPQITSVPPTDAAVDDLWLYQAIGFDPDGDTLTWGLDESTLAAPTGLTIDPLSGRLTWIPTLAQLGDHAITITADDGRGAVASQSFVVTVDEEPANRAPYFTTTPSLVAIAGVEWVYEARAVDPEFELVTYGLVTGPAGMEVDPATGLVAWTPGADDVGTTTVALRADDGAGDRGSQVFLLTVRAENHAPVLATTPAEAGVVGTTYRYDAHATDSDGDAVAYELAVGPADATFDPQTGLLLWDVDVDDEGEHEMQVTARDSWGGQDSQRWTVTVAVDRTPPVVRVVPAREPACIGEELLVCVTVSDDVGVASRSLAADGAQLPLDAAGCAAVTEPDVTVVTFTGAATDTSGNDGGDALAVTFANCDDTERPTVDLVGPTPGAVVTGPVEIVATIADNEPAALTWTVKIARAGTDEFTLIAEGSGPVTEDVVAVFDPTALPNDSYEVEILASDGLQTGGVLVRYGVGGEFKLGNVRMTFTDLVIPVAGIPLAVTRTYDSLDTTPGDFGAGWRLGLSGAVSDPAVEVEGEGLVALLSDEAFTRTSRVYVTKPSGERVGFTFAPVQQGFPTALWVKPAFEPDEGVRDTLEAVDGPTYCLDAGGRFYDFIIPYNPSVYALTTPENVTYTISEANGLELVEDALGNTLEVTPGGVVSSSGVSLVFERDDAGRITRVIEPDPDPDDDVPAGDLEYEYDAAGNLVLSRDQRDEETTYHYEEPGYPHYLSRVVDPLDRPLVRYAYGEDGRLLGTCDAAGDPATLAGCETWGHDPTAGLSTHVDGEGHRMDLFYDERGNVVIERRWLDEVAYEDTTRLYNDRGDILQVTDASENAWLYTWDARGRRTSSTDPGGNTWTRTFGECDLPESECDPLGNCTWNTYDDACRLLLTEDALGGLTVYTYDAANMVETLTDPVGGVWSFTYDGRGLPITVTDPDGDVESYEFGAVGEILARTTRNGQRIELGWDSSHQLVEERVVAAGPDGEDLVTTWIRDAAGQVVRVESPTVQRTVTYHATGHVETVDDSGTPGAPPVTLTYAYDGNGRVASVADSLGGVTEYRWDALGRPARATQTGAGVAEKRVDLAWTTGAIPDTIARFADADATLLVAETTFDYECGACPSRLTSIAHRLPGDAPLHDIALSRDAAGNILAMTDAEGTHGYTVDALRRIISVDHPEGGPQPDESYTWDAAGNRLASHGSAAYGYAYQTDEGGDRLVADDRNDYEHDGVGNRVRRTNRATGEYTTYAYDHKDRLTEVVEHGADGTVLAQASYVYAPGGYLLRSDEDGVITWYVHDGPNAVLALAPDGEVRARYLYGRRIDEVYAEEVGGQTRWLLRDHVGTVRDVIGDDGTALAHYVYDSFGMRLAGEPPAGSATPLTFGSRPFSAVSGLGHYRRRAYDAAVGRFAQPDPRPPWAYVYADGAPNLFIDPTGEATATEYAVMAGIALIICDVASFASAGKGYATFLFDIFAYVNEALVTLSQPPGPVFSTPLNEYSLIPCGLGELAGVGQ